VFGIVLAVIVILASVAFMVYRRYGRGANRYLPVEVDVEHAAELSLFDDEDDEESSSSHTDSFSHGNGRFGVGNDSEEEEEQPKAASPKEDKLVNFDD